MATKAQYAAARKANAAYKAAKTSSAKAKVYSSASKSLWVNWRTANKIYKSNTGGRWTSWAYNKPTPPTPTPTPASNQSNLGGYKAPTGYWDVTGNRTDRYTGFGTGLSWGKSFTDFSNFWGIGNAWQSFDRFGKAAEGMQAKNPDFLSKRNDAYGMDIRKNNTDYDNLDEFQQKELIKNYIKGRDTRWELNTASGWEDAINNTVESLWSRIWKMEQAPIADQQPQTENERILDQTLADIGDEYSIEKNRFLMWANPEDRFTNWNEVNDNINNTLAIAWQHKADNWYTGTPTDQQIVEIAEMSGNDFATTKKIMEGRWYEDLELQSEFRDEAWQPFDRNEENLITDNERQLEDVEQQNERNQMTINASIDDVQTQMERNIAMREKAWALSWANRSSWYMQWLENIRNDALKNIERLNIQKDRDTADTAKIKWRIIEDFTKNIERNKENLNNTLNSIKTSMGAELNQYLLDSSPTSDTLTRKLRKIKDKYGIQSFEARKAYNEAMKWDVDVMTYATEKALKLQQSMQNLQQTNVSNLLANNGLALQGMTYNQLGEMLTSWELSQSDYGLMKWYMQTLWLNMLQNSWAMQPQDAEMYNGLLAQGYTPAQAIQAVKAKNPTRFTQSIDDKNIAKTVKTDYGTFQWNPNTGKYDIEVGWDDTNTQIQASWVIEDTHIPTAHSGGIDAKVDSVARPSFEKAFDEMAAKWLLPEVNMSEWVFRTHEQQQKLYDNYANYWGPLAARPWTSAHEKWLAVDITNWTPEMAEIMNANGWYQTAGVNDMWHFEYVWTQNDTQNDPQEITIQEIMFFNDDITRRKMSTDDVNRIGNAKKEVMSDPNASINDIMMRSNGWKNIWETQAKSFGKFDQALMQLWSMQEQIEKANTWPIVWRLANMNPRNSEAQILKAQLQWLIPNIARWVYWEVWVLTDNDVRLYSKTLPSLESTEATNKWVLALTLDILAEWYKKQLATAAGLWYDVSGLQWTYTNIKGQADALRQEIGMGETIVWDGTTEPTEWWSINDIR